MAQAYYPARNVTAQEESAFTEKHLKVEDVQEAYIEQKDRLVNAIDSTKAILLDLRDFNKDEWVVRYPQLREEPADTAVAPRPGSGLRRSLSFADDPSTETKVIVGKGMTRTMSLADIAEHVQEPASEQEDCASDSEEDRLIPSSEFQVLRLDLKLGSHTSNSAASLVSQLEKSSIANLLDERLSSSVSHIDKLRLRVQDTSSKVLVTGDLNAGKSTFVNALLRREVMPVDQQPCTTAFCEVHDAADNGSKEEVHVLKEGVTYDINDESTFSRLPVKDLESVVSDNEEKQPMLKLYLADTSAPSESLLNNGVVDISLIDAPGLNRDSLKTTALFARQEEIDVVVFVVSAENHFTLSAKEFLWNASNEKAYLFIVVNKFDQIKNKEKCKRLVLEQIKQLSPRTYEDAEDLVHFVDSATALQPYTANPSFDDLESSLRSFVLVKRSKSKLHPATTYLLNLLADVDLLANANSIVADSELEQARSNLAVSRPVLEKMKKGRDDLEEGLENIEEENSSAAFNSTQSTLAKALELVGQGKLGVEKPLVPLPSYPGLLGVWDYAKEVRKALLASLDAAVKLAEDESRVITSNGVDKIKDLAEEHLPEGVERSRRVFVPEAMFAKRGSKGNKSRRSSSQFTADGTPRPAVVAGGVAGLGIGLAQRPDMVETSFFDLFDVQHQFFVHFGDKEQVNNEKALTLSTSAPSALSVVSLGVGALTMVGGQAVGARGIIEGVLKISEIMENETARKWAAPIVGAFTIGLTAYFVLELPSSVPRTVGRRIKASVLSGDVATPKDEAWDVAHSRRVERETRKVLRLAGWDLKERFRSAMEETGKEVKGAEEMEARAEKAKGWFEGVLERTGTVRKEAQLGSA